MRKRKTFIYIQGLVLCKKKKKKWKKKKDGCQEVKCVGSVISIHTHATTGICIITMINIMFMYIMASLYVTPMVTSSMLPLVFLPSLHSHIRHCGPTVTMLQLKMCILIWCVNTWCMKCCDHVTTTNYSK